MNQGLEELERVIFKQTEILNQVFPAEFTVTGKLTITEQQKKDIEGKH